MQDAPQFSIQTGARKWEQTRGHQHRNGRSVAGSQCEGPIPLKRDSTTVCCCNLIMDSLLNSTCSDLGLGTSVDAPKARNHLWKGESRSSAPNSAEGKEKQERRSSDPHRSPSARRRRSPEAAAAPFADEGGTAGVPEFPPCWEANKHGPAGGPMRGPDASMICEIKQFRPFRPIKGNVHFPSSFLSCLRSFLPSVLSFLWWDKGQCFY